MSRHGREIEPLSAHRVALLDERYDHLPEQRWVLERMGGRSCALRVSTISAGLHAIESGAVMGLLPRFMGRNLVRLAEPELPPRDLWLVVHEDLRRMPHIRATMEFLESCTQPGAFAG